jgi:hypothetical protein
MQYRTMCVVRITLLLGGILCVEAAFAKTDSGVFKLEEVIELAMQGRRLRSSRHVENVSSPGHTPIPRSPEDWALGELARPLETSAS